MIIQLPAQLCVLAGMAIAGCLSIDSFYVCSAIRVIQPQHNHDRVRPCNYQRLYTVCVTCEAHRARLHLSLVLDCLMCWSHNGAVALFTRSHPRRSRDMSIGQVSPKMADRKPARGTPSGAGLPDVSSPATTSFSVASPTLFELAQILRKPSRATCA